MRAPLFQPLSQYQNLRVGVVSDSPTQSETPRSASRLPHLSYGAWRQETLDSHGGWIASSIDLARFVAAFDLVGERADAKTRGGLLKAETAQSMFSPHALINKAGPDGRGEQNYGYGWMLRKDGEGRTIARHGGALACTASSLIHFPDNINIAVLFNLGQSPNGKFLGREIDGPLITLVEGLRKNTEP